MPAHATPLLATRGDTRSKGTYLSSPQSPWNVPLRQSPSGSACFWACSACLVLSCYQRGKGPSLGGCPRGPVTAQGIELHLFGGSSGRHSPSRASSGIPGSPPLSPSLISWSRACLVSPILGMLSTWLLPSWSRTWPSPSVTAAASLQAWGTYPLQLGSARPRQSSDAAPPSLGLPYR